MELNQVEVIHNVKAWVDEQPIITLESVRQQAKKITPADSQKEVNLRLDVIMTTAKIHKLVRHSVFRKKEAFIVLGTFIYATHDPLCLTKQEVKDITANVSDSILSKVTQNLAKAKARAGHLFNSNAAYKSIACILRYVELWKIYAEGQEWKN